MVCLERGGGSEERRENSNEGEGVRTLVINPSEDKRVRTLVIDPIPHTLVT